MIVPSLYADLRSRGVKLSIAKTSDRYESPELPPLRLHVRAPVGALNESLRAAISDHRDELVQFIFELEEAAAILVVMQQNRIEDSEQLAYACVTGGTATPDGQLWLREYAERELQRMGVSHLFEVVSVERVSERVKAA
jgi:hypothetical protein